MENLHQGWVGSFKIEIEPKDTEVSVRYDIFINQSNITNQNIVLFSVKDTDTGEALVETDVDTYTGVIPLASITNNYVKHVEITFLWENDDNSTQDILLGITANLSIQVPISVTVTQYMGETIESYT